MSFKEGFWGVEKRARGSGGSKGRNGRGGEWSDGGWKEVTAFQYSL